MSFDADAFRLAMRRMAATVTIVSMRNGRNAMGMTATAVTPVSMDPPSLLIAVNRKASIHLPLTGCERFCINILSIGQQHLAAMFGSPAGWSKRFEGDDWATSQDGIPYLVQAQANLFCVQAACWSYATHSVIVGNVCSTSVQSDVSPLIYANGQYHGLGLPASAVREDCVAQA